LTGHDQALAWFEAEYHVLLSASALAIDSGLDSHGWLISWAMHPFLATQGHHLECSAIKRMTMAAGIRDHDAIIGSGARDAVRTLGDFQWVPEYYASSLKLYQQLGNRHGEVQCLYSLAVLAEYQRQYTVALAYAQQAVGLCRGIGDKAGETELLSWVGWYHALVGDYPKARGLCREALALNTRFGSRRLEGDIWNSLGYTEYHAGDLAEAAACYERALSIFRTTADRWGEADTLTDLGEVRRAGGELLGAREAWQQALVILDDLQHPDAAKVRAKLTSMDS
jgi:tetratricopeptide (TPR) repeat protein